MSDRPHPPAYPHGELTEVLPDVFFVTGTVRMAPLIACSRNMTVVREGERLIVLNSLRMDEAGLAKLDKLGTVTDVVRLAGFHGMDDPFYKERYGAKVWNLPGASYQSGFDATKTDDSPYFRADEELTEAALPLANARLQVFSTRPPEGLLLLERDGGILIAGDALQHWHETNEYFSFMGKLSMKMMGFIKPHNVGPGWLKAAKPERAEVGRILEHEFEHLLPAHGDPVVGGAKAAYRPAVEAFAG